MPYETVIGLEIHAQLNTQTKMFCSCDNDSFGKEPNMNACPVCMGFPGTLPVANRAAIEKGVLAALALNCKIQPFSKFDRKHYFYPDLPKGFQISQYDQPLATGGFVEIEIDGQPKKINITRLHLEDDAGKLIHAKGGTLCDYNRAGTPLAEIVSEPELSSPLEARLYAEEVHKIVRAVGASDADMEKGMLRFDINVSLRPLGAQQLGTKTEVKNLNSFKHLELALAYEIKRQEEVLNSGGKIVQETRGFDLEKGITYAQRSKEEAKDYRYFPEPDLPPLTFSKPEIAAFKAKLPELPALKHKRYQSDLGLSPADAKLLSSDQELANYFEAVLKLGGEAREAANWINSVILGHLNEQKVWIKDLKVSPAALAEMLTLIKSGTISKKIAKDVLEEMFKSGKMPAVVVKELGVQQVSNSDEIEKWCQEAIKVQAQAVADYRAGKGNALGSLVGYVMKLSRGQANPGLVNETLKKLIK